MDDEQSSSSSTPWMAAGIPQPYGAPRSGTYRRVEAPTAQQEAHAFARKAPAPHTDVDARWPEMATECAPSPHDLFMMHTRNMHEHMPQSVQQQMQPLFDRMEAHHKHSENQWQSMQAPWLREKEHASPPPPKPTPRQSIHNRQYEEDYGVPLNALELLSEIEQKLASSSSQQIQNSYASQHTYSTHVLEPVREKLSVPESAGHTSSVETPQVVLEYDDIINNQLSAFFALCDKIGGDVAKMSDMLRRAFDAQRTFLADAVGRKKPDDNALQTMLAPTSEAIVALTSFREQQRRSIHFNHLSAISESIGALGWVTVAPTPVPHIKEMSDASQFYTNRVLKEYKDKDATHVEWVKAWLATLEALRAYVKQHHTTGLVWNSAPGFSSGGSKPAAPAPPTGAPPPPPPPPADLFKDVGNASTPTTGGGDNARQALMSDLSQGEGITSRLKKVPDAEKTHKNPALRAGATVPSGVGEKPPAVAPKLSHLQGAPKRPTPPPRCEKEGEQKWMVEHQRNAQLTISVDNMKQVIYIYKCEGTTVIVKGKANSITMDNCKKTNVVFDALVSQMEVINCQSVKVQTLGSLPTLAIQKTDGCQVFLSKESRQAEIITSKSSEMNISIPDDSGDFTEYPVPEQFKTVFDGKALQTTVTDIV